MGNDDPLLESSMPGYEGIARLVPRYMTAGAFLGLSGFGVGAPPKVVMGTADSGISVAD